MCAMTLTKSLSEVWCEAEAVRKSHPHSFSDQIVADIYENAEEITKHVLSKKGSQRINIDQTIDNLVTSKWLGYPLMLLLLVGVFWITIEGANIPSAFLATWLFAFQDQLTLWFQWIGAPAWVHGVLVLGVYRTSAWFIAVMLPPMAIFFPLFTLLEDSGYLPRIAFNLDHIFKKAKACGKQSLTMCMGFGCNAAGVTACRIIDSPRERLIAILTNNFVPCNGRFPTLIAITSIFIETCPHSSGSCWCCDLDSSEHLCWGTKHSLHNGSCSKSSWAVNWTRWDYPDGFYSRAASKRDRLTDSHHELSLDWRSSGFCKFR